MHNLRPLLQPASIALVGAVEGRQSPGRIVHEKLVASGYAGALYVVDPGRPSILGQAAYSSLSAIGKPIDLVLIATPADAVVSALKAATMAKVAIVIASAASLDDDASRTWLREIRDAAKRADVRVVGPGALGMIRPSANVDATWCGPPARPGRLALVTQSAAVAAAMVDYATPLGLGFSTVLSVGAAVDAGFGELLDLLLGDAETDAILVQVEDIGETPPFLSALRAAARTKPVVVLKAGRSLESRAALRHDDVVDAAISRCGAVRVRTSTQLFAAARICAKRRGFGRLRGTILRSNEPMLGFVRAFGFVVEDDPEDPGQVFATLSFT
jgi:acetyltransferase